MRFLPPKDVALVPAGECALRLLTMLLRSLSAHHAARESYTLCLALRQRASSRSPSASSPPTASSAAATVATAAKNLGPLHRYYGHTSGDEDDPLSAPAGRRSSAVCTATACEHSDSFSEAEPPMPVSPAASAENSAFGRLSTKHGGLHSKTAPALNGVATVEEECDEYLGGAPKMPSPVTSAAPSKSSAARVVAIAQWREHIRVVPPLWSLRETVAGKRSGPSGNEQSHLLELEHGDLLFGPVKGVL